MSTNNSTCPEPVATWPVGNWSPENQVIGLTVFVVYVILFVASVAYMLALRHQSPYKTRNVFLVALSGFGARRVRLRDLIP
jgi:hypothetical protein